MRFFTAIASLASVATAATVAADVDANVKVGGIVDANVKVDANVNLDLLAQVDVKVDVDVDAAVDLAGGFTCIGGMEYCPWSKSCSCKPGLSLDPVAKVCTGTPWTGSWPEPKCEVTGVAVELTAFCAYTPAQFVKYDPNHKWCQVGLTTITFCAESTIEVEIEALGLGINLDVEVDLAATSTISVDLRNTCAGLAALFIGTAADAVVLFNTHAFGLAVVAADVQVSLGATIFGLLDSVACILGLGPCQWDCLNYCVKGCGNYIDVPGSLGDRITGLLTVTIVSRTLYLVGAVTSLVTIVVDDVLCIVGRLLESLLTTYNCGCHA